jgi:AcrR family transcriptional regulator
MVQTLSRRDRVRAATAQEIIQTCRHLLVSDGTQALSLRAIAREMGMTAPALYRYFPSHDELLRNVAADIFTELAGYIRGEIEAAAGQAESAGAQEPGGVMTAKLIAACQAFRSWGLAHRPEYSMIFASPLPALDMMHRDAVLDCGFQFGQVFLDLFTELWRKLPFPVPDSAVLGESMRSQLSRYAELTGSDLPLGAVQVFLRCWVVLYGTVSLEVFGHLQFALEDPAPMFDLMLADLAALVGLRYPA